jgi:signal peptidase I
MQVLTSFVLAAFVAYIGSWYVGYVEGNFALLLFIASSITGLYWIAERLYFWPARQKAAAQLEANDTERRANLLKQGITHG